ncbi:hypothetical protein LRD69_10385 [Streptomyces sp. JH14]|uniref:hypothetical protein n=1 Tax=Streptomyces sp. JH14 TaxID=2793630 RepID=UPI0023F65861|nr:hypothetical protein [Streptomyces sp. JH14]MDF6042559.1 hypothetical protein [Streptomyces sp. JH14]
MDATEVVAPETRTPPDATAEPGEVLRGLTPASLRKTCEITYDAKIGDGRPAHEGPHGIVRRRVDDGRPRDEAFTVTPTETASPPLRVSRPHFHDIALS